MTNDGQPQAPIRVLAVDDEPAIRDVYRLGLTQFGCRVRVAADGREALHAMILERFDVLIVDIRMDGMDGLLFLQEALRIWPWVGVIIVSGHITADATRRAAELGVIRMLHKPVALKELFTAIQDEASRSINDALPAGGALSLMKNHLQLLSRINEQALATRSLADAMVEFGSELSGELPADVVAILIAEHDETALLFDLHTPVAPSFIAAVTEEVLARYRALSGRELALADVHIRTQGCLVSDSGPAAPGGTLSVPVFMGSKVSGALTLASASVSPQHSPADAALLYQAANNIAAIFTSLRRMHQIATRDPLTGLFNRIRMEEELERAWQLSRRYGPDVSVVVIDLDHFKTLNDTYGHATGDDILRSFGDIMRGAARATDILARYGGDEFVATLPRADEAAARAFCERLLQRTRDHVFCPGTHRLSVSISIGMAASNNPSKPSSATELLAQADKALYQAKRSGRNRICVWREKGPKGENVPAGDAENTQEVLIGTKSRARVAVVDDEPYVLRLVSAFLDREDCESFTFTTALDAIEAVRMAPRHYDLILTDIAMPGMSGLELLKEISQADDLVVKIVMTGYATVDNAVACLREGAFDFIEKPMDSGLFSAVIKRALEYRSLKVENARHHAHLERMVQQRSAQLSRSLQEVKDSYRFTLEAFIAILDARETHTSRHSLRVRDLAVALARFMGLPEEPDIENISTGALLHDIGKIGIPDRILFHAGPLSPDEWAIMRNHAELGHRILSTSPYMQKAAELVLQHHEHFDGSGYPNGLKGEDICLGARIFAVVDAFDAMRSDRVYRGAMSADEVSEQIHLGRGTQFDATVVDVFEEHRSELDAVFNQLTRQGAVLPDAEMPDYLTHPTPP
jgi:diguanylate cyclase (GGDEF)-like protein/putative nucleotidyltransferase with HDIG domain